MDHLITYSFDSMSHLISQTNNKLSESEIEIMKLYSATLFQKQRTNKIKVSCLKILPKEIRVEIYSFLSLENLVKLRELSKTFRNEVDLWISKLHELILYVDEYNDGINSFYFYKFTSKRIAKRIYLSPCSIASFLCIGGMISPLEISSDDDSSGDSIDLFANAFTSINDIWDDSSGDSVDPFPACIVWREER